MPQQKVNDKKNQQTHLRAERDILSTGGQWLVPLLYSFQDSTYLYLVMEYLPGGDLMNLLIARNVIAEDEARFYIAEIVLAIGSIHAKGYIHRDLKPDNVLIDRYGHIKLSDFGLCKKTDLVEESTGRVHSIQQFSSATLQSRVIRPRTRQLVFSAVGTPDYIAPEMLRRTGYTEMVDWWAVGIMLYEMMVGYAPFTGESNEEIYYRIENHNDCLWFPKQVEMSWVAIDLISRLLVDEGKRLGKGGVQQIMAHKWFDGIDWNNVKKMVPPFIPLLDSDMDARYFDQYEELEPWLHQCDGPTRKDFNFIGYTYKQQSPERNIVLEALDKVQQQKREQRQKEEKQRNRIVMNKKNRVDTHGEVTTKTPVGKILINDKIGQKSQVMTERSKGRLSRSPLQARDSNRMKVKPSSKSPLKTQKSICQLRKVAITSSTAAIPTLSFASGDTNKPAVARKSTKKGGK